MTRGQDDEMFMSKGQNAVSNDEMTVVKCWKDICRMLKCWNDDRVKGQSATLSSCPFVISSYCHTVCSIMTKGHFYC